MTVDPRLQLTPGEYLIHPDGSASKVVDRRNMTVDEILATGQYRDRRGRAWSAAREGWTNFDLRTRTITFLRREHMRLLIERDQHRDVCPTLCICDDHPVPFVQASEFIGFGEYAVVDTRISSDEPQERFDTLPEAMDAARALAVGE